MMSHYTILYRGPLSSCNYGCEYCPFAKRNETHAQLEGDRIALARFVDWIGRQPNEDEFSVFFTPWGEALIRRWYQDAIATLSNRGNIRKVAIQTNISCSLGWLSRCNLQKLGLWCTYHPGETPRGRFLDQCAKLDAAGARYSVGVVGMKQHVDEIEAIRARLRKDVYLWVNAYKRVGSYYAEGDLNRLATVDPLFPMNNLRHASLGEACDAGETTFSVDGDGNVRRCHFINEIIGNIYAQDWQTCLCPRACTNQTCGCHIGYIHMPRLGMKAVFGDGLLERIPQPGSKAFALALLPGDGRR
jgi:MoaA/NifB/PqqE/SkfB family radical SAM enzyme